MAECLLRDEEGYIRFKGDFQFNRTMFACGGWMLVGLSGTQQEFEEILDNRIMLFKKRKLGVFKCYNYYKEAGYEGSSKCIFIGMNTNQQKTYEDIIKAKGFKEIFSMNNSYGGSSSLKLYVLQLDCFTHEPI